jgi:hypothetical protein
MVGSLKVLPELLYWLDACHSGVLGWRAFVYTDCSKAPVRFVVEGPVGDYAGANKIAECIAGRRSQ